MKKYAAVAMIGNHNLVNGHGSIECTVKDVKLIKDCDDRMELVKEYAFRPTEYKDNGKWYSYSVMKRTEAHMLLKRFDKLG